MGSWTSPLNVIVQGLSRPSCKLSFAPILPLLSVCHPDYLPLGLRGWLICSEGLMNDKAKIANHRKFYNHYYESFIKSFWSGSISFGLFPFSFTNANNAEPLKILNFLYKGKRPDKLSGHLRIWPDKTYFWPDIVRWPAVISSSDPSCSKDG